MSSGERVSRAQTIEKPASEAAYLLGDAFDEMYAPDGEVRGHYRLLQARMTTLGADELAERQQTLERSFLLQGITFTVYGAESATERIIPTDLFPRIIPSAEWTKIETGLIQRLTALNLFRTVPYTRDARQIEFVLSRMRSLLSSSAA